MKQNKIDELCINTIRLLAVDMVEKAKSGHPGLPLGVSPIAYTLWAKVMKHNPKNPNWVNRDRFVLSAGHGSAMLYALLHLGGYGLPMDELKQFRQWGSLTPGHPEYGHTKGVEVTTGPLGQGFANAVGMAIAEAYISEQYNQKDKKIIDYYTYVICGDGDLMEGVSSEAASIAGHLGLGKLICMYDDNKISIEGETGLAFTESVLRRFKAYNWQLLEIDGNDTDELLKAIDEAKADAKRPTMIKARTHIGYGSPHKQDTASAHGEALGEEEIKLVKKNFHFPVDESFYVPAEAKQQFKLISTAGSAYEQEWQQRFREYKKENPELADLFSSTLKGELPLKWDKNLPVFNEADKLATRQASAKVLNTFVKTLPMLVGGSADLAPSTGTYLKGYCDFGPDSFGCPNFHFGVREHAMGAILNGMALSQLLIPYGSTFFVFSDYMKPAIRLAALMKIHSIFVFTHDSIALGEDGPTHQPVEHLAMLRATPNLRVIRPADANETIEAWRIAITSKKPTALVLSRQKLPVLSKAKYPIEKGVSNGAYILVDSKKKQPDIILIASGSEVSLAMESLDSLTKNGIDARLVSMPSWELFSEQSREYQNEVIPKAIKARVSIEAGSSFGWKQWLGDFGISISVDTFGASAPGGTVMAEYGFTVENLLKKAMQVYKDVQTEGVEENEN